MNDIKVFQYNNNEVRTVQRGEETWWVLKDVCDVLGLGNPSRVIGRLEEDEVTQSKVIDSLGREQPTSIVNEAGLYNVILRSDKPEARAFKRWVTHEVLPTIRRHGMYAADDLVNNPDAMIRVLEALKAERAEKAKLEAQAKADLPKVLFANAVSASPKSILIGDLAKLLKQNGIEIGQNRLFEWLRANGYLIRGGSSRNVPTQRAMEMGLFEIQESCYINSAGMSMMTFTTKVTGKGQQYFIHKFLSE